MGFIFGPDGTYSNIGGMTFFNGNNGEMDTIDHVSGMSSCSHGNMANTGGISYFNGGMISKSGNTYFGPNGMYMYTGGMLTGNSKTWYGAMSDHDIRDIIAHDSRY